MKKTIVSTENTVYQFTEDELKAHDEEVERRVHKRAAEATMVKLHDTLGCLPIEKALLDLGKYCKYLRVTFIQKKGYDAKAK